MLRYSIENQSFIYNNSAVEAPIKFFILKKAKKVKMHGKPFTTHDVQLEEGDSVYIYSDGFIDQFGGHKGKKFMGKLFREALVDAQKLTREEQGIMPDDQIENWRADPEQPGGESEQMDDILVIGVHA